MQAKFVILAVFTGASGFLAFFLNVTVCLAFIYRGRILLTPSGFLLLSMAVSDLLVTIIAAPMVFISNINEKWVFGDVGCQIYGFAMTWFGLSNIMHLAAASLERYATIGKPLSWSTNITKPFMGRVIIFIWLYTFIFSICPVFGWSRYALEGFGTACSINWQSPKKSDKIFTILLFVFCFFLPLLVIFVSYGKACQSFREMVRQAERNWGHSSQSTQATVLGQKKFTIIVFSMIVGFMFAWLPYAIISIVSVFGRIGIISPTAATIPCYLAKTSTLYNPLIYVFKFKRFRSELQHIPIFGAIIRRAGRRVQNIPRQ